MIKKVFNTDADRRRSVTSLPIGSVMLWHNDSAPTGWLLCNGAEVAISSYPALYNLITVNATLFPFGANTDGSGNAGSSHFRLPDMTDRFLMSPSVTGSSYANLTKTAGSNTHNHSFNQSINVSVSNFNGHTHSFTPGSFAATGTNHTHTVTLTLTGAATTNVKRAATGSTGAALQSHSHTATATPNSDGSHGHSFTGGNGNTNSSDHAHVVLYDSTPVSPSAVSHVPLHQRFYFVVLAAA